MASTSLGVPQGGSRCFAWSNTAFPQGQNPEPGPSTPTTFADDLRPHATSADGSLRDWGDTLSVRHGPAASDSRACFGSRSILVNLTEESSDGGYDRTCTCSVDQIETVTDTWQLDVAHRRR